MFGTVWRTIGLVALGWKLHSILASAPAVDGAVPPWWDDVMLRAYAPDQVCPPPKSLPQAVADACGAAAAAHRIPIAWLYALVVVGLPPGQVQVAASVLHDAAIAAGPLPNTAPATLSAWRKAVVGKAASLLNLQLPDPATADAPARVVA